MNKQGPDGIGWCDYTWNVATGCWGPGGTAEKPNRCSYCYAEKVAQRFYPTQKLGSFTPTFHPERLSQPAKVKKPSRIFVCSMADLFGDWVPDEWIEQIIIVAQEIAPHHTFQFLTKNPRRLQEFNPWPANCWVGATVTNQADADERLPELLNADAAVRFVSVEPLLGNIWINSWYRQPEEACPDCGGGLDENDECPGWYEKTAHEAPLPIRQTISWLIIGSQTGPGAVKPHPAWVQGLVDQCRAAGTPLFLKENLKWPEKIQELPA